VGVNAATVVRFAQRVGFSGWADFQLNFRHRYYLGTLLPTELMRERAAHDGAETWYEAALQQDIANLTAALKSPQSDSITAAASTIAKSRRTLVAASGSYVAPAQVLSHLGSFMGYEIEMESRGGAHLVASLSRLTADDCIVVVSFWRLLRQEVLAAQYCRRSGIPTVVIADSAFSPLTKAGDIAITVPTDGVAFFQSVTTATSVVYAILAELHEMGGEHVSLIVSRAQEMFDELDVLYS
jgi:DNA-binding MurR/RpiR family transcriptional regulator